MYCATCNYFGCFLMQQHIPYHTLSKPPSFTQLEHQSRLSLSTFRPNSQLLSNTKKSLTTPMVWPVYPSLPWITAIVGYTFSCSLSSKKWRTALCLLFLPTHLLSKTIIYEIMPSGLCLSALCLFTISQIAHTWSHIGCSTISKPLEWRVKARSCNPTWAIADAKPEKRQVLNKSTCWN